MNWREYDASLRQRGSLTVWFTEEAVQAQLRQSHWEISRKPLISRGETDAIPGFSEFVVPFPALFSA